MHGGKVVRVTDSAHIISAVNSRHTATNQTINLYFTDS